MWWGVLAVIRVFVLRVICVIVVLWLWSGRLAAVDGNKRPALLVAGVAAVCNKGTTRGYSTGSPGGYSTLIRGYNKRLFIRRKGQLLVY